MQNDEQNDFLRFMGKRERMIRTGVIARRPPLFLRTEDSKERAKRRHKFMIEADRAARKQADMDKSDPFIYGRAMVSMLRGIHAPSELDVNRRIAL